MNGIKGRRRHLKHPKAYQGILGHPETKAYQAYQDIPRHYGAYKGKPNTIKADLTLTTGIGK